MHCARPDRVTSSPSPERERRRRADRASLQTQCLGHPPTADLRSLPWLILTLLILTNFPSGYSIAPLLSTYSWTPIFRKRSNSDLSPARTHSRCNPSHMCWSWWSCCVIAHVVHFFENAPHVILHGARVHTIELHLVLEAASRRHHAHPLSLLVSHAGSGLLQELGQSHQCAPFMATFLVCSGTPLMADPTHQRLLRAQNEKKRGAASDPEQT